MRKKLLRFEENKTRDNILEPGKPLYKRIGGKWNKRFFKNNHPIVVELGAGRGIYTTELAKRFPKRNFIGVDVKGDRLWYGSTEARSKDLKNVGFLRTEIQRLDYFFAPGEIDEIWITFPDPHPKRRNKKHRLTHERFLQLYKYLLRPEGIVHIKTDNKKFFKYTLERISKNKSIEMITSTNDLYATTALSDEIKIKTHYEKRFLSEGKKIKYIAFKYKQGGFIAFLRKIFGRSSS